MEKRMFYVEIYKSIILTLILVLFFAFYQKHSSNENSSTESSKKIPSVSQQQVNISRDALLADLKKIASSAQEYFRKPAKLGGGGNSFKGFKVPDNLLKTENMSDPVSVVISKDFVTLEGVGKEIGNDGHSKTGFTIVVGPERIVSIILKN